jgi:hypothetical protein
MRQLLLAVLFVFVAGAAKSQDKDAAATTKMVESKNFVFKAQSASSQRGRTRQLTSEYDLVIKGDSIVSWLPFFGRAFTAPINNTDGGIKFTSTDFSYSSVKGKKDSWEINIKPKDVREVQQLNLSVYANGTASLRVTSTNRDMMSFLGYVKEGAPTEKKAF